MLYSVANSEQYSPDTASANLLHEEIVPDWMGVGVDTVAEVLVAADVVVEVPDTPMQ
jgi:hypothetical protein